MHTPQNGQAGAIEITSEMMRAGADKLLSYPEDEVFASYDAVVVSIFRAMIQAAPGFPLGRAQP